MIRLRFNVTLVETGRPTSLILLVFVIGIIIEFIIPLPTFFRWLSINISIRNLITTVSFSAIDMIVKSIKSGQKVKSPFYFYRDNFW